MYAYFLLLWVCLPSQHESVDFDPPLENTIETCEMENNQKFLRFKFIKQKINQGNQ